MERLVWHQAHPAAGKALFGLHHYITKETKLSPTLIELVFLRVSLINGCAHCIDMHTRALAKNGVSYDKLALVPVWFEAKYLFSEQEQAALAWAEEVTNVRETHASDEAYAAVSAVFSPEDLVDLTATIAAMNAFNRMGISFRLPPAAKA